MAAPITVSNLTFGGTQSSWKDCPHVFNSLKSLLKKPWIVFSVGYTESASKSFVSIHSLLDLRVTANPTPPNSPSWSPQLPFAQIAASYVGFRGSMNFQFIRYDSGSNAQKDAMFMLFSADDDLSDDDAFDRLQAPFHVFPRGEDPAGERYQVGYPAVNANGTDYVELRSPFMSPYNFMYTGYNTHTRTVSKQAYESGVVHVYVGDGTGSAGTNCGLFASFGDDARLGVFVGPPLVAKAEAPDT